MQSFKGQQEQESKHQVIICFFMRDFDRYNKSTLPQHWTWWERWWTKKSDVFNIPRNMQGAVFYEKQIITWW